MMPKPILKQFGDLTATDFAAHPVWVSVHTLDYDEPWYGETDEETFRPWTGLLPVDPHEGMFLVRCELTLADGRVLQGFLTPQFEGEELDLGIVQPQVFSPAGKRHSFWDGMFKRADEVCRAVYAELGADPDTTFPIQFDAERGLATGVTSGQIPGFCFRPNDTVQVYF